MDQALQITPWYKHRWPWILMAGPSIVIVAGLATAWLAIKNPDGLVDDDYYKQGLAINQRLHKDNTARERGISALVRIDATLGKVEVEMKQASAGAPALPPVLAMRLAHQSDPAQDVRFELIQAPGGRYIGSPGKAFSGRWNVTLEDKGGQWRLFGPWQSGSGAEIRLTPQQSSSSTN